MIRITGVIRDTDEILRRQCARTFEMVVVYHAYRKTEDERQRENVTPYNNRTLFWPAASSLRHSLCAIIICRHRRAPVR